MRFLVPALLMLCALPAAAQETRQAEGGATPPPAQIEDLHWLVGHWEGEGIGGNPSTESWLAPFGNAMIGTFVQSDGDDSVMFTEHMQILERDDSLVLLIKHFNPDLTGWEEKDDVVAFPLVALEDCAAFFAGLTMRCAGSTGLFIAVRMHSDPAETEELVFEFTRTPH